MIELGHRLGMTVVAEGVEWGEHRHLARQPRL
jgi:EAL domain-containing protein (putative c-di-GMP-specific phosphodiesterase class I)